ncbi:MAG: GNAT family N-acetyltransferase [Trueperaceae bacterium]
MTSPTIRLATHNDLQSITEIYNDAILNTTAVYSYEPITLESRSVWLEDKAKQNFPVFVAEKSGQLLGFSSYGSFRAWPAYLYSVENSIYVHPNYRGQGIGTLLMPPLLEAARKQKMHTMIAGIDASNEVSLKLHQGFGFEKVAHFKQVGFKFNRWLDLVFMQLMLHGEKQ